jgi:hypothetical protein
MALIVVLSILNANLARSTKIAAEKGLTELERPWIFLEGTTVTRRPGQPTSVPNYWYISLHVKNLGRMPAIIDSCLFEIKPKTELPEKPVFSDKQDLSCPQTLGSGDSFKTREVGPAIQNAFLVFTARLITPNSTERLTRLGLHSKCLPTSRRVTLLVTRRITIIHRDEERSGKDG